MHNELFELIGIVATLGLVVLIIARVTRPRD